MADDKRRKSSARKIVPLVQQRAAPSTSFQPSHRVSIMRNQDFQDQVVTMHAEMEKKLQLQAEEFQKKMELQSKLFEEKLKSVGLSSSMLTTIVAQPETESEPSTTGASTSGASSSAASSSGATTSEASTSGGKRTSMSVAGASSKAKSTPRAKGSTAPHAAKEQDDEIQEEEIKSLLGASSTFSAKRHTKFDDSISFAEKNLGTASTLPSQRVNSLAPRKKDRRLSTTGEKADTEDEVIEVTSKIKQLRYAEHLAFDFNVIAVRTIYILNNIDHRISENKSRDTDGQRPPVYLGKLGAKVFYEDPKFQPQKELGKFTDLDWKRPKDAFSSPVLFGQGGTNRFDLQQAGLSTCWALAILCSMPERHTLLKNVIPRHSYRIDDSLKHDGIFHCRFWRFGRYEDVFIDDRIPFYKGTNVIFGATNRQDPNEMWPCLLEKAFAKFMGSYELAARCLPAEAFLVLTGGTTENLRLKYTLKYHLIIRINNGLNSGALIITSARFDKHGIKGIYANQLYLIISIATVTNDTDTMDHFLKVLNTHGEDSFDATIPPEIRKLLPEEGSTPTGIFWISYSEFQDYFDDVDICNMAPDFDQSEGEGHLDQIFLIRGEWFGRSAGGTTDAKAFVRDNKVFDNPCYHIMIPHENLGVDNKARIVFQVMQPHLEMMPKFSILTHVFKVNYKQKSPEGVETYSLTEITNEKIFKKYFHVESRYRLPPGEYILVPSTMLEGQEEEYLFRIFQASSAATCRYFSAKPDIYLMRAQSEQTVDGRTVLLTKRQDFIGEWIPAFNAGGQIKHKTYATNPQFIILPTGKDCNLLVSLKQRLAGNMYPVGFSIMKIHATEAVLDFDYLNANYRVGAVPEAQERALFVKGGEAFGVFPLNGSEHYVIIVYLDEPGVSQGYLLTLTTDSFRELRVKTHNFEIPKGPTPNTNVRIAV